VTPLLKNPIIGIAGCCARPASGYTVTAPPKSEMKSRRLIGPSEHGIVSAQTGNGKEPAVG